MRPFIALKLLLPLLIVCLLQAVGWGAAGYDACLQEEKRFRLAETEACSGLSYIFNPSACFIARKELTPYDKGKCRAVAEKEGVTEQKSGSVKPAAVSPPAQPATVTYDAAEVPGQPQLSRSTPAEAVTGQMAIEQLRSEISTLKEEVWRLKEEIAGLKRLPR